MNNQFQSPMKIELDFDVTLVLVVICVAAMLCTTIYCVYRYNALPYEQGYSQQQLQNGYIIWVKEPAK